MALLQQPPAEQAERGEDRQHRGGEHRVAGKDREPGAGEDREAGECQGGRGDPDSAAPAQQADPEHDAAEGADHPRPLQHLAEPSRAVEDEVDRSGLAIERVDRLAGAGEGVGRAARRDPVEENPKDRRGQSQGDQAPGAGRGEGLPRPDKCRSNEIGILSIRPFEGVPLLPIDGGCLSRPEQQVEQVGEGEEPGLGAQEAGGDEQGEDRPACARAPGLDQQRAEAEGDVGEVDVGAQAVGEEGRPGEDEDRGDGADRAVEPERTEPEDEVADQAEREVGDDHGQVDRAAAEGGGDQPEGFGQRVRGGGQRGPAVGAQAFAEFPSPDEA